MRATMKGQQPRCATCKRKFPGGHCVRCNVCPTREHQSNCPVGVQLKARRAELLTTQSPAEEEEA